MIPTCDHLIPVWVCTDCYFAHHYGIHEHPDQPGIWYAGDTDTPADRKPLSDIEPGRELTDWTDSNLWEQVFSYQIEQLPLTRLDNLTEAEIEELSALLDRLHQGSGIHEFSTSACDGCGTPLHGARYRLALWDGPARVGPPIPVNAPRETT